MKDRARRVHSSPEGRGRGAGLEEGSLLSEPAGGAELRFALRLRHSPELRPLRRLLAGLVGATCWGPPAGGGGHLLRVGVTCWGWRWGAAERVSGETALHPAVGCSSAPRLEQTISSKAKEVPRPRPARLRVRPRGPAPLRPAPCGAARRLLRSETTSAARSICLVPGMRLSRNPKQTLPRRNPHAVQLGVVSAPESRPVGTSITPSAGSRLEL